MEDSAEKDGDPTQYYVDLEGAKERGRSIAVTIAGRRCYVCQQGDTHKSVVESDPQDHIDRIVEQCSETSDYLLPDTPLREALFRVILANGNRMITAEEISEDLSERWAMSTYPRDLSPKVIGRILDHSESYSITSYVEPEPEVEEVEEEEEGAAKGAEEEAVGEATGPSEPVAEVEEKGEVTGDGPKAVESAGESEPDAEAGAEEPSAEKSSTD